MTRYIIDTSFVVDHLRGDPDATARFARLFSDGDEAGRDVLMRRFRLYHWQ